jgi:hypothetical protein
MQIADLRLLMRLPVNELEPNVGCNVTTASMMLNVISGMSVWFFQTDEAVAIKAEEEKAGHRKRKKKFIVFIETYWPKIGHEPAGATVATRLYEVRNSLAHDLSLNDNPTVTTERRVSLAKLPLAPQDIVDALERNEVHPLKVPIIEEQGDDYTVHLVGLYWAVHKMLRASLQDQGERIEKAMSAVIVPDITEASDDTSLWDFPS